MSRAPVSSGDRAIGTVAIRWHGGSLELLDQRLLPDQEHWITLEGSAGAVPYPHLTLPTKRRG